MKLPLQLSLKNSTFKTSFKQSRNMSHFFAAALQNWDLQSSKKGPIQSLYKQFSTYFQYKGLVAVGFEGSKFLPKC